MAETFTEEVNFAISVGGLWQRPAAQSLNSVNWRHIVNQNPFDNGSGVGGENYANEVTAIGWNLSDTVGVPAVTGKAAVWDNWEYKFNIGGATGKYYHERHMEMADTSGNSHRFFSFAVPHDGGAGSSHLIACDAVTWMPFDVSSVKVQWQLSNNVAYFGTATQGFQFNFAKNNSAPFQQRNGGDTTYLKLPYFDNNDRLLIFGRQQNNPGAIPSGGNSGIAYNWNNGEIPNGSTLFAVQGASQTNSEFYAFYADASTNWRIKSAVRNTHATGFAQMEAISSGPAFFRAHDFTILWSFGKNAAGNFFLGNGDPGTGTVLTVDKTNLNADFVKPPKLPNYTVATLPNAFTYGAGSLIYVSDETGGAVVAFSDGTNWRRMTDRAIVS